MKRTAGFTASVFAMLAFALAASAKAETVSSTLYLTPANEVPAITTLNAIGGFQVTVAVTRDGAGAITSGSVRFLGNVTFPGSVIIRGFHIHEGVAGVNSGVVVDTGLNANNTLTLATGAGILDYTVQVSDGALLGRLLKNPPGFYVNLHTSVFPGGAIRGQLVRFEERQVQTLNLTTENEVPPPPGFVGSGVATITASPKRDDKGVVIGGETTFSMQYDVPAGTILTGLHIHEGAVGVNAGVVINTGLSAGNSVTLPTGKGSANFVVPITAASLAPFQRMLANPSGFYVNLHTSVFPGGVIRNQLSALNSTPPIIQQSDTYFLDTTNADATVKLLATGVDLASVAIVNGQVIIPTPDITSGVQTIIIPAALRANAGVIFVQARNAAGLMSTPIQIVVAPAASVNTVATVTVDSAKFGNLVAPNSIAAAFGTNLASTTVSATTAVLPFALDGTTVYVNGIPARLFFVTQLQVNYLFPEGTPAGEAQVVIVAKDGTVSRGVVNVSASAPGIFTRTSNGLGAPAAVASVDGQVFSINMSNADGTPVAIDAGNFVSLFGTGFRYGSTAMTMSIGGTAVTPLGFAAQSQFAGLDQANVQIPQSLAGRGDVDLTLTIDGKTSNTVKLKIK
ncbi:MAG: CHRD domain-containing protein [Acidobacteriota bacterium]